MQLLCPVEFGGQEAKKQLQGTVIKTKQCDSRSQ